MKQPSRYRPKGMGKNFTKKVRGHAGRENMEDLRRQAELRERSEGPPPSEFEVVPGIGRANYLPALGRMGNDDELDEALFAASTEEARTCRLPRTDRPGLGKNGLPRTRPYIPLGATEYFHSNLPPHLVLALRWGAQIGLKNPTPALDANLVYGAILIEKEYGVRVVASVRHTPNPYTGEKLRKLGWVTVEKDHVEEKFGGWNYHHQVYCSRVVDGRLSCKHPRFRHCHDVLISTLWLKEYGVDVHAVARATKAYDLRQDYEKEATKLPRGLESKIFRGKISRTQGIAAAIALKMKVWDAKWLKGKHCKNAGERASFLLEDKRKIQEPVDWFLCGKATADLQWRLVELDPAYEALLEKGKWVYRELKTRHYSGGYRQTLNGLLAEFENSESAAAAERKKRDQAALEFKAREVAERQEQRLSKLEAQNAALVATARKPSLGTWLFDPDLLKAALAEANKLVTAGKDLSTLPKKYHGVVEISPPMRTKRIPVVVDGKIELVPVLGKDRKPVQEANPAAGKVGLTTTTYQFALTMITGLEQAISGVDSSPSTLPEDNKVWIRKYEEVLAAHRVSTDLESVDWEFAKEAIERLRIDSEQKGDENFLKEKYQILAQEGAKNGDPHAWAFLQEIQDYFANFSGIAHRQKGGIAKGDTMT